MTLYRQPINITPVNLPVRRPINVHRSMNTVGLDVNYNTAPLVAR